MESYLHSLLSYVIEAKLLANGEGMGGRMLRLEAWRKSKEEEIYGYSERGHEVD